jgi:predicted nucleic-acid-binding protein
MTHPFLDTNIIIRFLTGDDPQKQAASAKLFEQVEKGSCALAAPDTVIADAVYVLSSKRLYNLPRQQVSALLIPLVRLPGFHVQNRKSVLRALDLYASTNLDFGDTLIISPMEQARSHILYSYDMGIDGIPGIKREEPKAA